jgi:hypothetical protein
MVLSQRRSTAASRRGLLILRSLTGSVVSTSLYELKQVPQAWYSQFATYLLILGFVEAKCDTSLFVFRCGADMVYLLLYVDNIVLTASSTSLLQHTISALKPEFAMKDLALFIIFWGFMYNIRQMASSSLSTSSLSTSLSASA